MNDHNSHLASLVSKLNAKNYHLPVPFEVVPETGTSILVGNGTPEFRILLRSETGLKALISLNQLLIAEAYMQGDIDFEGSIIKVLSLQDLCSDQNISVKTWRHLEPILFGRKRCNPQWISKHYDSGNIQLFALETEYNTYTPGIYDDDEDMEAGAERKLKQAFEALALKPDDRVLDIGSGWGGFLRYAVRQGAHVTGITLSRDQHAFVERLIEEQQFDAEALYQDFFTFNPSQRYDGISMMGVLEDLSDYRLVMQKLPQLIKPGKRVYLDFAASKEKFGTSSFVTKYIWPGKCHMVFLPKFIEAVRRSPFELISIENDRRNYHLWAKGMIERWEQHKTEIVQQADEYLWRKFHLLYAGTSSIMERPTHLNTAYRVVLEYPADVIEG